MAGPFTRFGNDLYSGARVVPFVRRRRVAYIVSAVAILLAIVVPFLRGGFHFGIEFTGGAQFTVSDPARVDTALAQDTVQSVLRTAQKPTAVVVGGSSLRIQTEQLTGSDSSAQVERVQTALESAFQVPASKVGYSYIGATWGSDISGAAVRALVIFLVLVAVVMALYFRTWKMSVAGLVALAHDLIITAGVYGIVGFEVTPAAVIGFLTILGYSLYDTVVVFDKIRENTALRTERDTRTFGETVNLSVNQTLVRSINTSVIALLPIAAILFIGALLLGVGTLQDIALALFIGILVGTYSTIFIAAPLYTDLRGLEAGIRIADRRALSKRQQAVGAGQPVAG